MYKEIMNGTWSVTRSTIRNRPYIYREDFISHHGQKYRDEMFNQCRKSMFIVLGNSLVELIFFDYITEGEILSPFLFLKSLPPSDR